ncbi:MAG TPA: phosphodiester glycosidase family protein, partial [Anaerolineales bacterium]|nr:phosphodiester glycosidase family protein [Anaerolineales bacterium]
MVDGRLRFMLAAGMITVTSALTGLGALADPGFEAGLPALPALEALAQATEEPEPPARPFAERLREAGSIEALVSAAPDGWVPVATGVDYSLFKVAGPNNVHVARMARSNLDLFLETSIGLGRLTGGAERISSQFARYEGAINYWGETWGNTNDVLVAINGSFWDDQGIGIPDRGMVQSGWYAKRFTNNESGSGFVWKLSRQAFIGECVFHMPANQLITYAPVAAGETEKFQGVNRQRAANEIVIYTHHYDKSTQTDSTGVEVLVEMTRPMLILPAPAMALGTVRAIRDLTGNTNIPFDHVVLSATGTMRTKLLANLSVGDVIGFSNSITTYQDSDCATPMPSLDFTKAYASLGGSYYFLEAGEIKSPGPTPANPLTAIAFNDEYIFFIVVDGRSPGMSVGMTIDQLAIFVKDTLGATYGINQDGGGSSTMVIDGMVVNVPSDMFPPPVCHQVFIPMVTGDMEASAGPVPTENGDEEDAESQPIDCKVSTERPVANGIMIVALQPKTLSTVFFEGAGVVALESATVRLGPGTNYASIATVGAGSSGVVQPHAAGLNGVYAKGTHWWLVNFGSVTGWV